MFLVDDDQSQPLEGQEKGRTHTEDNVIGFMGKLFLPHLYPLGIGELGVVDAQPTAEDPLQALGNLGG